MEGLKNLIALLGKKIAIGKLNVSIGAIAVAAVITTGAVGGGIVYVNSQNDVPTQMVQESTERQEKITQETIAQDETETTKQDIATDEPIYEDIHYHNLETVVEVEATCTKEGSMKTYCTECDYVEYSAIPANHNHTNTAWKTVVEATELEEGLKNLICEDCNSIISSEVLAVIPCTHKYVVTDRREATCDTAGYEIYSCSICASYYEKELKTTGHSYGNTLRKEATCSEEGYTYKECISCGHISITGSIDKLEHELTDWTVDKEATCVENGVESRKCKNCDYIESKETIGHDFVTTVVAPTCTDDGYTVTYICMSNM